MLCRARHSFVSAGAHAFENAGCLRLIESEAMTERNCMLASYRFFGVNDGDRVVWEDSVTCFDDAEAVAVAQTRSRAGVSIEVWEVGRFVGRAAAH